MLKQIQEFDRVREGICYRYEDAIVTYGTATDSNGHENEYIIVNTLEEKYKSDYVDPTTFKTEPCMCVKYLRYTNRKTTDWIVESYWAPVPKTNKAVTHKVTSPVSAFERAMKVVK